jgi:hypothetical protein
VVDGITVFTGDNEDTQNYTHHFTNIGDYHTIHVTFAQNCYALNPLNQIGAGVTITPTGCVPHGSNVTFNFVADCYDITQVFIDGEPQGPITTYPMTNVTEPLPVFIIQTTQ